MSKRSAMGSYLVPLVSCLLLVGIAMLGACSPRVSVVPPVTLDVERPAELCVDEGTGAQMSYTEALALAEQSACAQEGDLTATRACDSATGAWLIDLEVESPLCEPVCVVDINTGSVDIDWRCIDAPTPEDAEPTPTTTPDEELVETPTATAATPEPETATPTPELAVDLARYTNEAYGFAFHYPISWSIALLGNRPETVDRARAVRLTRDDLELLIEYRQPDEDVMIGPDNLPEGEVIEQDTVTLLNRVVPKYVLEQEGRVVVIFAGDQYVDLDLYIELRIVGEGVATAEIPDDAQNEFDRLVASFERTGTAAGDPYPDWARYAWTGDTTAAGFAFRYPLDWALDEIAPAEGAPLTLNLRKDTLVLQLQVRNRNGEALLESEDTVSGSASEAGTVSFLGIPTSRYVEVEEGQLRKVFINYDDGAVRIHIALGEDPDQTPSTESHLSEVARHTMDQILASFTRDVD